MTADGPILELENVRYRYAEETPEVLRGVSLTVPPGQRLLVAGPSGCGKSTLLRCLNGLVPHFHGGVLGGRVRVAGRDPVALGPRAMSEVVGFVFQDPEAQFVTDRVEDELAFAMENRGLPWEVMDRRIGEVLTALDLAPLRRRRVATLSGGERQRLALGSVLALQPPVLVLDEPTSQLDPRTAEVLLRLLTRLNQQRPMTVVLSEHRLERVAGWAERVCWLSGPGQPPRVGPPREVLATVAGAPPLARLGRRLGWRPPPLTVEQAEPFARALAWAPAEPAREPPAAEVRPTRGAAGTGPAAAPPLEAHGLAYRYPGTTQDVLRGVDLSLEAGERVALMGANGSGKSTLLKCLVGLIPPCDGRVVVAGLDHRGLSLTEVTAQVGFVPQNPSRLLFQDTVAEELRFTRRSHGLPAADDARAVAALLGRLGLAPQADAYPGDLSTGERQRLALAAILAAGPRALLLDEPTRGLDTESKDRLAALLAELAADGTAVLMATHDVELVARWARRVVVLRDGVVVSDGPMRSVMAGSPELAPQILRLFPDRRLLTEDDVVARLLPSPEAGG